MRRSAETKGESTTVRAMIVAPETVATEAGLDVLRRGGNAVDAAVTAAFVQGVAAPFSTGLGGFGLMTLHLAGTGRQVFIDFQGGAGSNVREGQWESIFLGQTPEKNVYKVEGGVNDIGYGSIGIPGNVRGFALALERFGTIGWAEAIEPAIRLARAGIRVSKTMHEVTVRPGYDGSTGLSRLKATRESARVFTRDGAPYGMGELIPAPDYAATLERLATEGPDDFYEGEIAERMAADLAEHGSGITASDLREYRPRVLEPLRSTYRGVEVVTAQPPAGGIPLLQMLNFLEGFDSADLRGQTAEWADRIAAAMAWAFRDRDELLGDPRGTSVPTERLTSKAYAEEARARFCEGERFVPTSALHETGTTHVSVVDASGNAVSMTHTLGAYSGVVTPGLGFLFNNHLGLFDPRAGQANSLAPGRERISMMSPTLVFEGGRPRVVLGARGGTRIVGTVLHVLVNLIDGGMNVLEAVCAPRIDCQGDVLQAEGRIRSAVVDALRDRGWSVHHSAENWSRYFAKAQVIDIAPDGTCSGVSDPRADGGFALGLP